MKKLHKLGSIIRGFALGIAILSCAPLAKANTSDYFTTSVANGGTYYWDLATWSTSATGPFTSSFATTDFARFTGGAGDTYTVVVSNTESTGGAFNTVSTATVIVTNSGGGNISITTTGATSMPEGGFTFLLQGFLTDGIFDIYCPITGAGGIEEESGGGHLNLYGTNTYTGGTLFSSSGTFVGFNNPASFGNGPICFDDTTFSLFENDGPSTLDLTNNIIIAVGTTGIDFLGTVTMGGNWNLGNFNVNLRNGTVSSTSAITIAGVMSNTTATVNYTSQYTNTILLTGANTYTGPTVVGLASFGLITLEIGATGSIASTTVSNSSGGGTLKLDGPNCLSTNATLALPPSPAAGSVNLNFTGTQSIAALRIGGVLQSGGTYGSSTSGAANTSATFIGNGVLSIPAAPTIVTQPQSVGAFNGGTATFTVVAAGAAPLTYQWFSNSVAVPGANSPTFTFSPVTASSVGNYYHVSVSNIAGTLNSQTVGVTLIPSNSYTAAIQANNPIAYWRLDETSGTVALDSVSTNNGTYVNVTLGQTGYSLTDPDASIGLPTSTNARGYVVVSNSASTFNFTSGNSSFTFEGWAFFTNLNGVQRLFSTLGLGNGYAFGINGARGLRFTQGSVQDVDFILPSPLVTGTWYQLAVTCDGFSSYFFYVNGVRVGTVAIGGVGVPNNGVGTPAVQGLQMGANPPAYFVSTTDLSEQVRGNLDEMAVYGSQLGDSDIANHFAARYATPHVPVVLTPLLEPATNYVSLSTTIVSVAGGPSLNYQWFLAPSTMISGATASAYTIPAVQLSDSGSSFFVQVSNGQGTSNSPVTAAITVLPIPTNAADLNLTNKLVMHLPFDGNDLDATGRGNNGTNVGTPSFVSPGLVGASALHYSSAPGSFNYVNIGVRPDLQFGSNIDFSVSFWVRETNGSAITNLPFFADTTNASGVGFEFTPYATSATSGGGWQWDLGSISSPNQFTPALIASDVNLINDGNWHHLAFVAQRSANLTTYLDGSQVDSQAINFLGNVNTSTSAVVGQDSSGAYAVTAAADIDDLGVWTRTLSDLEISGIYLAGISNNVSFAATTVTPVNLSITNVAGTLEIIWPGLGTLQATTNLLGTNTVYTNVVGAASPYTIPTPQNSATFYRLKQQ